MLIQQIRDMWGLNRKQHAVIEKSVRSFCQPVRRKRQQRIMVKRAPSTRVCGAGLTLQSKHYRPPRSRDRPAALGSGPELRQRTSQSSSRSRRCRRSSTDCPCQHPAAAGDLQTFQIPYSFKGLRQQIHAHGSRLRPACKVAQNIGTTS